MDTKMNAAGVHGFGYRLSVEKVQTPEPEAVKFFSAPCQTKTIETGTMSIDNRLFELVLIKVETNILRCGNLFSEDLLSEGLLHQTY